MVLVNKMYTVDRVQVVATPDLPRQLETGKLSLNIILWPTKTHVSQAVQPDTSCMV